MSKRKKLHSKDYVKGIQEGDCTILGRTITLIESNAPAHQQQAQEVLTTIMPLTGNAIRVPTPNVSLAILNLEIEQPIGVDDINGALRLASLEGDLQNQIDYVNSSEAVSSDFVGNRFAGIVDAQATIANGKHCTVYVWYDNEFGYSRQVVRCLEELAGVVMPNFPQRACAVK